MKLLTRPGRRAPPQSRSKRSGGSPTDVTERVSLRDDEAGDESETANTTERDDDSAARARAAAEQSECPVCFAPFAPPRASDDDDDVQVAVVVTTECGHKFCAGCLHTAALRTPSCPICRCDIHDCAEPNPPVCDLCKAEVRRVVKLCARRLRDMPPPPVRARADIDQRRARGASCKATAPLAGRVRRRGCLSR